MTDNLEPQDCYSASALMQLGGRVEGGAAGQEGGPEMGTGIGTGMGAGGMTAPSMAEGGLNHGGTWPLMIFDMGNNGSG
jgi:hypothetical protein